MNIQIDDVSQLKMVKDIAQMLDAHNKRAREVIEKTDTDVYDLLMKQGSLINEMSRQLVSRQMQINGLKAEIVDLKAEIKQLEREIRVDKDLLAIARVIKNDNSEENH